MEIYNIHETKTHLSSLLTKVDRGESFVIARAGKPVARVIPYGEPSPTERPVDFLKGKIKVPENFDTLHQEEIISLFEGDGE